MWGRVARWVTTLGDGRWCEAWAERLARPTGVLGHLAAKVMVEADTDLARAVVDRLDLADGERVLDVGCGPGQGVDAAGAAADVIVHAVDPAGLMLARVRRRHRRAVRRRRLLLHHTTIEDLDLLVPLQAAFGVEVVAYLDDRVIAFTRLHDLLEPGGRLALGYRDRSGTDPRDPLARCARAVHRPVTSAEVEQDLVKAGLAGVSTVRLDRARRITVARRPAGPPVAARPRQRARPEPAADSDPDVAGRTALAPAGEAS